MALYWFSDSFSSFSDCTTKPPPNSFCGRPCFWRGYGKTVDVPRHWVRCSLEIFWECGRSHGLNQKNLKILGALQRHEKPTTKRPNELHISVTNILINSCAVIWYEGKVNMKPKQTLLHTRKSVRLFNLSPTQASPQTGTARPWREKVPIYCTNSKQFN